MSSAVERAVSEVFRAIESRDLDRVADLLDPDATWQNVPYPTAVGRDGIIGLLDGIIPLCERVEWQIVSSAYGTDTAWLERVDRFWIDGECHAVPCHGVFVVDTTAGRLLEVRDYLDLGLWRTRIEPVLTRRAHEDPASVVGRHLAAVGRLDLVGMAADYALDATLSRPDQTCVGRSRISSYFSTVSGRMAGRELHLGEPEPTADGRVTVRWTVTSDGERVTAGVDTYVVESGRITNQVVRLDGDDF